MITVRLRCGVPMASTAIWSWLLMQQNHSCLVMIIPLTVLGLILRMATSQNAELLASCGPRNPYPGKLGVIEEGAYADLLLVNGNPLENIDLVADPDANFTVIMKDGAIYKNTVAR